MTRYFTRHPYEIRRLFHRSEPIWPPGVIRLGEPTVNYLTWALIALTGCTGGYAPAARPAASPSKLSSPAGPAALACQDNIAALAGPSSDLAVIFDQVALPTSRALQASRSRDADPRTRLFAKQGLLVASGSAFELIVPTEWEGRLLIGWGSPGQRTTRLIVSGCRTTDPAKRWLAFAGGFWVGEPACVGLDVKVGDSIQRVQIGVGAACPGQDPPPPGA